MKILLIIRNIGKGGKERQFSLLANRLAQYYEIIILTYSSTLSYHLHPKIKLIVHSNDGLKRVTEIAQLAHLITKMKPDIVHSWDTLLSLICLPFCRINGIRFINGSIRYAGKVRIFSVKWALSKIVFHFSDTVISNSRAGLAVHNLVESKKNIVIYNGLDEEFFAYVDEKISSNLEKLDEKMVVGMLANLLPSKDHFTLIKAVVKLLENNYNIFVLLIGDGILKNDILNAIPSKYLNRFEFAGRVEDVRSCLSLLNIGVLLSNTNGHAEGISNALLEMMACKIPVIATNAGGNTEVIEDGVSGFLIEPFSYEQLAVKIALLIDRPDLRKEIGYKGFQRVKTRFSEQMMIRRYLEVYKDRI